MKTTGRMTITVICILLLLAVVTACTANIGLADMSDPSQTDASEEVIRTIACVGDSLTYGVIAGTEDAKGVNYPGVLSELAGDGYEVLNLGIPGCTLTETGRCYLRQDAYQQSIDAAADMYIIMLGTNDSNQHERWDAEAFEEALNKAVDAYRAANPEACIVLMAPPTVLSEKLSGGFQMDVSLLEGTIRETIKRVSEEKDAVYIDTCAKTTENREWIGEDGVHFTQEGYEAFAGFVYENIKDYLCQK